MEDLSCEIKSEIDVPLPANVKLKAFSITLHDITQDGLVLYDSECPKTGRVLKVGYCLTCRKTLNSYAEIYSHHTKFPSHVKTVFRCSLCRKRIIGREAYRFHLEHHDQAEPECNVCHKKFNRRESLRKHYELHSSSRHRCPKCDKLFNHKRKVREHLLSHNETRRFKCHTCSATFKTRRELRNHDPIHSGRWKYRCPICGYGTNSTYDFKVHKTIHGDSFQSRRCHKCGITFSNKWHLKLHLKHHKTDGGKSCSYCSATFGTSAHLESHIKVKHCINLICEICDKACINKSHLEDHFKEHDLKTVTCDLCNETIFDMEFSRKQHLIDAHGGFLKCRICSKIFYTAHLIRRHYKCLHPQHDIFRCENCGDIFLSEDTHTKHYKWCTKTPKAEALLPPPPSPPGTKSSGVQCRNCYQNFPSLRKLQDHLLSLQCQSLETETTFIDVKPPREIKLEKTADESEKKGAQQLYCNSCKIPFKNKLRLAKHMWHTHTDEFLSEEAKEKKKRAELRKIQRRYSFEKRRKSSSDGQQEEITSVDKNENYSLSGDKSQDEENAQDLSTKELIEPAVSVTNGNEKSFEAPEERPDRKAKRVKTFSCLECGKKYWKGSVLEAHIARRHAQENETKQEEMESHDLSKFREILPKTDNTDMDKVTEKIEQNVQSEAKTSMGTDNVTNATVPLGPEPNPLPNQISITIGALGQMQNVCIPVVINGIMPGTIGNTSTASSGTSTACFPNNGGGTSQKIYPCASTANGDAVMLNLSKDQGSIQNIPVVSPAYAPQRPGNPKKNMQTTPLEINSNGWTIFDHSKKAFNSPGKIANSVYTRYFNIPNGDTRVLSREHTHQQSPTKQRQRDTPENQFGDKQVRIRDANGKPTAEDTLRQETIPGNNSTDKIAILVSDDDDDDDDTPQVTHYEPGHRPAEKQQQRCVECFICDRSFNRINKLLHHLKNNHN